MKKINTYFFKFFCSCCVSFSITGCEKLRDFSNTNVNPNGSSTVLTSTLITNVESQLGDGISGFVAGTLTVQPGYYCQYYAETTYPNASLYALPKIESVNIYSGILMDCQVVINKNSSADAAVLALAAQSGSSASQTALARILKAYIYWTTTDRWGDMPYSEALKGVNFLTPRYDTQEEIYKGILKELEEAIDQFDEGGALVKGDIIYNGNIVKWRKFANSIRMLAAMRLSKRYPDIGDYAAHEFEKAVTSPYGFIDNNADNFTLAYPGGNYRNPYADIGTSADLGVAKTFTDVLTGLGDTRISALCSSAEGVPYGLDAATPTGLAKILSGNFKADNSSLVLINAASCLLAKAEAIELSWIPGDSTTSGLAYDAAVKASFEQWGLTIPFNYLTSGPANFYRGEGVQNIGGATVDGSSATTTTRLQRIALQQWIAFYPDAIQGWSNWRRTGIPLLKPTVNALGDPRIVRRYVYGTSEYSLNKNQLDIAISRFPSGADSQDERVWWDKP